MAILFQHYTENICFFNLSAGGLCDWGILLLISLGRVVILYVII